MLAERDCLIVCIIVFPPIVAALGNPGILDGGGKFL
jgi:hypothetical protein